VAEEVEAKRPPEKGVLYSFNAPAPAGWSEPLPFYNQVEDDD